MNKKRLLFAMLAAVVALGSCTRTEELDTIDQQEPAEAQEAVGFDIYTRSSVQTKAGYVGDIDETSFKVTGFGVYAYVSKDGGTWDLNGSTWEPDFMRNQHVTFSGGNWVYSPVKYWPNQANVNGGAVDNNGGTNAGNSVDYVSFFAYAPYVQEAPYAEKAAAVANAESKEGILYIPGTAATGNPEIVYQVATDPSNSVDLMYGVAAHDYTSAMSVGNHGSTVTAGFPFKDMTKLTTGTKMDYRFRHALAKLSVNVDGYFDEVNTGAAGSNDVDPNTRIVIESVQLKTDKLATKGTLNLNNTSANTPLWADVTSISGGLTLPIATALKHVSGSEGSVVYFSQQPLGVTKTKQSLMGYGVDGTTPASLMLIPNAAGTQALEITITYKVITRDARLENSYHVATNVIKNTIAAASLPFTAGTATTLNLHLGMTTVKFDATVSDWEDAAATGTNVPLNVPYMSFASPLYMSIWRYNGDQTNTAIIDVNGVDKADEYTFTWESSNTSVAMVSGTTKVGTISPAGVGETTITVTATKAGLSQTASFKVYVNAISAVTLTASKAQVAVGESSDLTATLTFDGGIHGPMDALPFTLLSLDADGDTYLNLGSQTYSSSTATVSATVTGAAYGGKHAIVSVSVPAAYSSSGEEIVSNKVYLACAPLGSTGGTFNGYYISSGNLQYQASTDTWRIAEKQYDYVGSDSQGNVFVGEVKSDNSLASSDYSGWIDLFGWGTSGWPNTGEGSSNVESWKSYAPWSRVDYGTGSVPYSQTSFGPAPSKLGLIGTYANGDWAVYNQITYKGAYIDEGWKTPTSTDVTASFLNDYIKATVNSIQGVIVLPSDFDLCKPAEIEIASRCVANSSFAANNFDLSAWEKMEAIGCAFLPCSGRYWNDHVGELLTYGNYWTTSGPTMYPDMMLSNACNFYFNSLNVALNDGVTSQGRAVRIIYKY